MLPNPTDIDIHDMRNSKPLPQLGLSLSSDAVMPPLLTGAVSSGFFSSLLFS